MSIIAIGIFSCNPDENAPENPIAPESGEMAGLYVLSEGTGFGNNASLSYFDYETGNFTNDYFDLKNPSEGGLGDVGNDVEVYGSKLYIVVNASNYVEVVDAKTAQHLGKITVQDCRSITFDKGFAYVTSFAGATYNGATPRLGCVEKIDTATLAVVGTVNVGYQPEELTVANGKLYVANSGGYMPDNRSDKISVIDLNDFRVVKEIAVGVENLSKIRTDKNGLVWVVSVGNYAEITPALSVINPATDEVAKTLNVNVTDFDLRGDSLYFYGSTFSMETYENVNSFGIININSKTQVAENFITDGTESQLLVPYGIKINPFNGDIFIADVLDYSSPGKVYCFDKTGTQKWVRTAGVCPAHFAFLKK
ncbi:MAG: YncE family protein [Prevotellaceae bacterium]|nr:YncE family protein [Prevotellaceae bacterium]